MSYETEYHSGYEPQYREGLEELAARTLSVRDS